MSKKEPSYETALAELTMIAKAIEGETISVDELADKVKRASELLLFCQEKLRQTETDVQKIIQRMNESGNG